MRLGELRRRGVHLALLVWLGMKLSFANGKLIEREANGVWGSYRAALRQSAGTENDGDPRQHLSPDDLTAGEKAHLVAILRQGLFTPDERKRLKPFTVEQVFANKSGHEVL